MHIGTETQILAAENQTIGATRGLTLVMSQETGERVLTPHSSEKSSAKAKRVDCDAVGLGD
jgi:hypothetical protein